MLQSYVDLSAEQNDCGYVDYRLTCFDTRQPNSLRTKIASPLQLKYDNGCKVARDVKLNLICIITSCFYKAKYYLANP